MPWDEIKPRKFASQAEAARQGAQSSGAEEQVPVAH
jgi:hypothetical protein